LFLLFVPPIVYKKGKGQEDKGLACGVQCSETESGVLSQQKILNHEAEDGDISFTEEARGGTDRVGMADDR
jgi:hypothetical protein